MSLPDVLALVADHFMGASPADDPLTLFDDSGRTRFYGRMQRADNGITVCSMFAQEKHDHCLVNVPGSALEVLPGGGLGAVAGFLAHLNDMQGGLIDHREMDQDDESPVLRIGQLFKVTRIDLAFDFVPFTVEQCIEAASPGEGRNVRSPVRKGTAFHALGIREPGEDGDSFTWGSRSSKSRMVRAYNRRGFVRFEMEWRGDRSHLLCSVLTQADPSAWPKLAIGHLRDFIDFIDRDSSSNVSRCSLLPWWAEFVQGVNRIRVKIERVPRSVVQKVPTWVKRTRKNVAKLAQAFGLEYVKHHLVTMGQFSLTDADRRDVKRLRDLDDVDREAVGLYPSLVEKAVSAVVESFTPKPRQYAMF